MTKNQTHFGNEIYFERGLSFFCHPKTNILILASRSQKTAICETIQKENNSVGFRTIRKFGELIGNVLESESNGDVEPRQFSRLCHDMTVAGGISTYLNCLKSPLTAIFHDLFNIIHMIYLSIKSNFKIFNFLKTDCILTRIIILMKKQFYTYLERYF